MTMQKIDHLQYQALQAAHTILQDLAEVVSPDMEKFRRAFTAHTVLGDMLEHDLEPEIVHTRPVKWTERTR